MRVLRTSEQSSNLVPIYMKYVSQPSRVNHGLISCSANSGLFVDSEIRLGSRGDSYYEYLL